ncbi:phosphoribosylglycinamide formyltransferase [bacterium]|nr:phosphoribosylglycinamide formyltransferase [bacterium]
MGVLISGSGTNLQAIIDQCALGNVPASLAFVASNKASAFGLERARQSGIPAFHISTKTHGSQQAVETEIFRLVRLYHVQLLCLAGYLKKVSSWLIERMPHQIINIHPGILPFMGGDGLYGHHVHERVLELGLKISGVTIHFVDEQYDHGAIIAQECVPVLPEDTADTLAQRVLALEHQLYPRVISLFARNKIRLEGRKVFIDD